MRWTIACLLLLISAGTIDFATAREWVDSTGRHRVHAELVAIRGQKVVLETEDGRIISIPIARLSKADRQFLQRQASPDAPAKQPDDTAPAGPRQLAARAGQILKKHCYRCHGAQGSEEGGFGFVHDRDSLVSSGYVIPRDPAQSLLFERMASQDSPMPPEGESPRPSVDEINTIKAWIRAGAVSANPAARTEYVTTRDLYRRAFRDLLSISDRDRRYARYFTINHLGNAGYSRQELETYQLALVKLINSLSWDPQLVSLHPVGSDGRLFRIDLRDLRWTTKLWERILADYPHRLTFNSREAFGLRGATETDTPLLRADWFVARASRPPLYHDLAEIPETDADLERKLQVSVYRSISQGRAVRIGFARSGVSQNNRLIERHESVFGAYWKSYDFGDNTGRKNLFEHPLGPSSVYRSLEDEVFQHDGGEVIFRLPNGMLGYMLTDPNGRRINRGPIEIVSDPRQPDRTVVNGVSCMSCHYGGFIQKSDEIRDHVQANSSAYQHTDEILAHYPEPGSAEKLIAADTSDYLATLAKIGVKNPTRAGEPIVLVANRYQNELDVVLAAAELGMKPDEFSDALDKIADVDLTRAFGALKVRGGVVKRQAFDQAYLELAVNLQLGVAGGGQPPRRQPARMARMARINRDSRTPAQRNGAAFARATQSFAAGLQAIERKDFDTAQRELQTALDLSEDDAFAARVLQHAIPLYERGESASKLIEAHRFLLNLCQNSAQINQARANFFNSLFRFANKSPLNSWSSTSRSSAATTTIRWGSKLPTSVSSLVELAFERQLRQDPNHEPSLHVMQLYWLRVRNEPQKRLPLLERLAALHEERDQSLDPESNLEFAKLLALHGDASRAAAIFAQLAERVQGSDAADLRFQEAEAWNKVNDREQAIAALHAAMKLLRSSPGRSPGYYLEKIGGMFMTLGEPAAARDAYKLALEIETDSSRLLSVQQKMTEALTALKFADQPDGDDDPVGDDEPSGEEMAALLDPTRPYRVAAEKYEQASSRSPSSMYINMSRAAGAWIKAEEPVKAAAALRKASTALRRTSNFNAASSHASLAELYQQLDQRQEAIDHFSEALRFAKSERDVEKYQASVAALLAADDSLRIEDEYKALVDPSYKHRLAASAAEQQRSYDARSLVRNLAKAAHHWSQAGDADEVKRVGIKTEAAIKAMAASSSSSLRREVEQYCVGLAQAYERAKLYQAAVRSYAEAIAFAYDDDDAIRYQQYAKTIARQHGIELASLNSAVSAKLDPLNRYRVRAENQEKIAKSPSRSPSHAMSIWRSAAEDWLRADEREKARDAVNQAGRLLQKIQGEASEHDFRRLAELQAELGNNDQAIKTYEQAINASRHDALKKQYQDKIEALK